MEKNNLLQVKNISKSFSRRSIFSRGKFFTSNVLNDVSFEVKQGEAFSIIGPSGTGKTTLIKIILGLCKPTFGQVYFKGLNVNSTSRKILSKQMQVVFQDPFSSLNPMMRIEEIIMEPLIINKIGNKEYKIQKIKQLINSVGLQEALLKRYPHQISGGQRQRVAIARALSVNPELLICDEPLSSIDADNRMQIIDLLINLQKENGLTYIFIAHDLNFIKLISHRIAIIYKGKIVEIGETNKLFTNPKHQYTKKLLSTI